MRRMRVEHSGTGVWQEESSRLLSRIGREGEWDLLRLQDVRSERASHGEPFSVYRTI